MPSGSASERLHVVVLGREELDNQLERGSEVITLAVAKNLRTPGFGRTCLIVTDRDTAAGREVGAITHIGHVESAKARTKLDHAWRLSNIVELPSPIPIPAVKDHLGRNTYYDLRRASQQRRGNGLTDSSSANLRTYLESVVPMQYWNAALPPTERFRDVAGREVLEEQVDAIRSALAISDMDTALIKDVSAQPFSVLTSLSPSPTEPSLIDHDLRTFPGMHGAQAREDTYVFEDRQHRLEVMNVNATTVEAATGVDLIYYNHRYRSIVAVQYKRMVDEQGTRLASIDSRLPSQLEKMARVEGLNTAAEGPVDYRLGPATCFVKLARSNASARTVGELVKGLYVPAAYVRQLLTADLLKGPRGGAAITHNNLGRWLNNTDFAMLVRDGWIGSAGVTVTDIRDFVAEQLRQSRSIVVAIHTSKN